MRKLFQGWGVAMFITISARDVVFITKREKAESEAQRGNPKGTLESEMRSAIFRYRC